VFVCYDFTMFVTVITLKNVISKVVICVEVQSVLSF